MAAGVVPGLGERMVVLLVVQYCYTGEDGWYRMYESWDWGYPDWGYPM